jgi:hypothetical protein
MDAINIFFFLQDFFLYYHYCLKDETCRINGIYTDAIGGNIPLHTVDFQSNLGAENENCLGINVV